MTPAILKSGTGYHIDLDFYRVVEDTPVELIERRQVRGHGMCAIFRITHPRRGNRQAYTRSDLVVDA